MSVLQTALSWPATMLVIYMAACCAALFLFQRAPDLAQRVAMFLFVVSFAVMAGTMAAALANGYAKSVQEFLQLLRQFGWETMQAAVLVSLGRLVWKEWICGAPRRC